MEGTMCAVAGNRNSVQEGEREGVLFGIVA